MIPRRLLPPPPPKAGAPLADFYQHDIDVERWMQQLAVVLGVLAVCLAVWTWWL